MYKNIYLQGRQQKWIKNNNIGRGSSFPSFKRVSYLGQGLRPRYLPKLYIPSTRNKPINNNMERLYFDVMFNIFYTEYSCISLHITYLFYQYWDKGSEIIKALFVNKKQNNFLNLSYSSVSVVSFWIITSVIFITISFLNFNIRVLLYT